ncbi:UNVERIFIED_CONTAM: hypothetical protein Sangu_2640700 [Sesamum angustifolium]|uniref:Uncharacterized protein n=1 Tax=Sesamum angustifolium TaxID=2727405 RepID=A0AAW2J2T3_9LAMI
MLASYNYTIQSSTRNVYEVRVHVPNDDNSWSVQSKAFDQCISGAFDRRVALVVACRCTDARSCHEPGLHDVCGLWTVNDLPAYGMGSGWSTAGIMGCPICMDDTSAFHLQHGRKAYWDTDEFKAKSAKNKEAQLGRPPNRMEETSQKLLEEHVSEPASGEVSSSDGPSSIVQEDQLWAEAAGGRKRG